MSPFLRSPAALILAAAVLSVAHPEAAAAPLTEVAGFGSNPGRLRMFAYAPDGLGPGAALVVALHGCFQTAADFDDETGWARQALARKFVLLLPEQRPLNNGFRCFNWFLPEHNTRGRGEARSILEMVARAVKDHATNTAQTFVVGLSAGGAMASVLLATHPEVFAGGAIIAGVPYKCANTLAEASVCLDRGRNLAPREWGDRVRLASGHRGPWPRVSIWHGSADVTVHPLNARQIARQWIDVHGADGLTQAEDEVRGFPRRRHRNGEGTVVVEVYTITGAAHGVPVAIGDGCGRQHPFMIDAGICASEHIARFWGLTGSD